VVDRRYLNYRLSPMDNISWRADISTTSTDSARERNLLRQLCDGLAALVLAAVEIRPEIAWYNSLNAPAFRLGPFARGVGTKSHPVFSADLPLHY